MLRVGKEGVEGLGSALQVEGLERIRWGWGWCEVL